MVEIVVTSPNGQAGVGQVPAQQQIIVIPQSLLAGSNFAHLVSGKKPVLKVSPNTIERTSLKRTFEEPITIEKDSDTDSLVSDDQDGKLSPAPPRKRANLDHLSPEEKLMRRKLKNRVAAQNARDKKRARMEDMEDTIKKMEAKMKQLQDENQRLKELNQRLTSEKLSHKQGQATCNTGMTMPPSPPESPVGSVGAVAPMSVTSMVSEDGLVDSVVLHVPSEPAELTNVLQPKAQGTCRAPVLTRSSTAPLKSPDMSPQQLSKAACVLWMWLAAQSLSSKSSSSNSPKPSSILPNLPLKKRSLPTT